MVVVTFRVESRDICLRQLMGKSEQKCILDKMHYLPALHVATNAVILQVYHNCNLEKIMDMWWNIDLDHHRS